MGTLVMLRTLVSAALAVVCALLLAALLCVLRWLSALGVERAAAVLDAVRGGEREASARPKVRADVVVWRALPPNTRRVRSPRQPLLLDAPRAVAALLLDAGYGS